MPLLLLRYWKQLLGTAIIVVALGVVYNFIYSRGYDACKQEWKEAIVKREELGDRQMAAVEELSRVVIASSITNTDAADARMKLILLKIKNKPLYNIIEGKCIPSIEFENAYRDILK